FARQDAAGLHALARERHLDDHVLVDGGDLASLAHHLVSGGGDHFAAHGTLHDAADLLHDLPGIPARLREQRRVGGGAVDHAERRQRLDVLDVAGIDKQFHRPSPGAAYLRRPSVTVRRPAVGQRHGCLTPVPVRVSDTRTQAVRPIISPRSRLSARPLRPGWTGPTGSAASPGRRPRRRRCTGPPASPSYPDTWSPGWAPS